MDFNCYGKSSSKDWDFYTFSGNFQLTLCPAYFTGRGFTLLVSSRGSPRHCTPHAYSRNLHQEASSLCRPKVKRSCSVVSDSSRPHGLQPTGLPSPWDSPGKSTGVGATAFPRGSSRPRDRTQVSCTAGRRFTVWATTYKYIRCSHKNTLVSQRVPRCQTSSLAVGSPQLQPLWGEKKSWGLWSLTDLTWLLPPSLLLLQTHQEVLSALPEI